MVISLTILTAIISTIIVITMASIFWCCWSKKDLNETKSKATKENSTNDKLASQKPEKVNVAETQSASKGEIKQPLLSSQAVEDNEDSGDFSVVQRETEILLPYRKPPPPKRARQTRVPRMMKSGTSDLFNELCDEEDGIHHSDKEYDETDNILLREDKDKSKRDTRSSMLTEIEQTIAALHMTQQSTNLATVNLMHENNINSPGLTKNNSNFENDCRNSRELVDKRSSSQLIQSLEIKSEPVFPARKDSPKGSPIAKPRIGPKVSPKPSPKARSKLVNHDRTSSTITEPTGILTGVSSISNQETQINVPMSSITLTGANSPPQFLCVEKTDIPDNVELSYTAMMTTTDVLKNEATKDNDSNLNITRSQPSSSTNNNNMAVIKDQNNENAPNSSGTTVENIAVSEETTTSNSVVVDRVINENTDKQFIKDISLENKEDSGSYKIHEAVNVEKEQHLCKQMFSKDATAKAENEMHLINQDLSGNNCIEKIEPHLDNEKFGDDNIVDEITEHHDNQKFDRDNSENKEGEPHLENEKFHKDNNEDKEDVPHNDNQKFDKDNSEDKENVSTIDNQKFDKDNSEEKEGGPHFDNQKFDKDKSENKDSKPHIDNQNFNIDNNIKKDDEQHFENQKFCKDSCTEIEEKRRSEDHILITNGKETANRTNEHTKQNGTDKFPTKSIEDESVEEVAQESSPNREIHSSQNEETKRGRSQETGKQQRDSSDDQTGRGKTSKIPVRAGSKPRTSPPKQTNSEKTSSMSN